MAKWWKHCDQSKWQKQSANTVETNGTTMRQNDYAIIHPSTNGFVKEAWKMYKKWALSSDNYRDIRKNNKCG